MQWRWWNKVHGLDEVVFLSLILNSSFVWSRFCQKNQKNIFNYHFSIFVTSFNVFSKTPTDEKWCILNWIKWNGSGHLKYFVETSKQTQRLTDQQLSSPIFKRANTKMQIHKYTNTQIQHITKCQKEPTHEFFWKEDSSKISKILKRGLFKYIQNYIPCFECSNAK